MEFMLNPREIDNKAAQQMTEQQIKIEQVKLKCLERYTEVKLMFHNNVRK